MNSSSGRIESEIATELILWRTRCDRLTDEQGWMGGAASQFANYLLHKNGTRHLGATREAVQDFLRIRRWFHDFWYVHFKNFDRQVTFFEGEPRIHLQALQSWRELAARLDQDAILCLILIERHQDLKSCGTILKSLDKWAIFPRVWDPGLLRVLQKGVVDTHIHFEASDPVPVLWVRLMLGHERIASIRRYRSKELEEIRDNPERHEKRIWERRLIERAAAFREKAAKQLDLPALTRVASVEEYLRQERLLLLQCWSRLKGCNSDTNSDDFIREFDRYLVAKSIFLSEHQQFPRSGAGLLRFREYLDRAESDAEKQLCKTSNLAMSTRMSRFINMAFECQEIRGVEFRIAPRKSIGEWRKFLSIFGKSLENHRSNGKLKCGLVVHFIRNPPSFSQLGFGANIWRELDRRTALLHLLRVQWHEEARPIVGLDVANHERGCSPEFYVPFLRLLRGDIRALRPDGPPRIAPPSWIRLEERGIHYHPMKLPRLGQTFHVGEDFYHLVTGLRHIEGLVDHLLEASDRIGHGVALGHDINSWLRRHGGRCNIPQGVLLDDLVWLRRVALLTGDLPRKLEWEMENCIHDLGREIYGKMVLISVLENLIDERFELPPANSRQKHFDYDNPFDLYLLETWNEGAIKRRAAPASPTNIAVLDKAAASLVPAAQDYVCSKVFSKGVTVEANVTSNLATGAVQSVQDHPIFSILKKNGNSAFISVNTDDPGVFATRIDYEYAAILTSLNDRSSAEAYSTIDKLRIAGLESTFLK